MVDVWTTPARLVPEIYVPGVQIRAFSTRRICGGVAVCKNGTGCGAGVGTGSGVGANLDCGVGAGSRTGEGVGVETPSKINEVSWPWS